MTKSITIKDMINNTNISPKLIRATIKQLRGFDSFKESAIDICNHGLAAGFGDFIYYTDTVKFYRKNRKDILELLANQSVDFGTSIIEMIESFKCIKDLQLTTNEILSGIYTNKGSDCIDQIQNCLAWYAGEEVARIYYDLVEEN
jgi:hypothetical protein